ncbi:hypothetical protein [Sabulibacter ruber]|uniref:hypothetical protein n=1 Tax=Sabulibacter ruber TaxID=2811901 RepID=UPI001A96901B|nr:hypothetical protein [Sabulibacter ruber]
MKKIFTPLLYLSILFSSSCASSYKPLRPETIKYEYSETSQDGGISTSFAYDYLRKRGNKKYVKKEAKNALKVVSVKVVNNTNQPIDLRRDCRIFSGSQEIIPMDLAVAAHQLRQGVPIYLLYSLMFLNFTQEKSTTGYAPQKSSITIPIGVPISIGNMMVASGANRRMKEEIIGNSILNKTVGPGETAYGTLCLNQPITTRIRFELNPLN